MLRGLEEQCIPGMEFGNHDGQQISGLQTDEDPATPVSAFMLPRARVSRVSAAADQVARETERRRIVSEVDSAMRQLRELLHSHGRLSNRNEALDEVAILLFSHAMSKANGGAGVSSTELERYSGVTTAAKLREFTTDMTAKFLPESLGHELGENDFSLRLKTQEADLANRVVAVLETLSLGESSASLTADILNEAFGRFLADSFVDEKELGQYLTPPEVVDFMVELAINHLTVDEIGALSGTSIATDFGLVLDPSCGVGSFLAEFIRAGSSLLGNRVTADIDIRAWQSKMARDVVVGLDKSERMIRLALANLALFGSSAAKLHLCNSLARSGLDASTTGGLVGRAGLILTNPPFGAEFSGADLVGFNLPHTWSKKRRMSTFASELLFMERYLDWLRPGGQLVAVIPDSVLTNKGVFADLRDALGARVDLLNIISLPSVAFAAAGTTTKTSVLHLRRSGGYASRNVTRFAICQSLGYTVSTRGSQRMKVAEGSNQLPTILEALLADVPDESIREVPDVVRSPRWDANYHASMSGHVEHMLAEPGLRVMDCARLVSRRVNPSRMPEKEFRYIEISDVDAGSLDVSCKLIETNKAPSRARQRVRSGDILVSTVRPERKAIGVVPAWLDGAVCTTGFAVLEPIAIDPLLLAGLLQTDFVVQQLLRNNVGIAYPAIEPSCLPEVMLPIGSDDVDELGRAAIELREARSRLFDARQQFDSKLQSMVNGWLG
jgi:SAM-dependent methyltransferase